MDVQWFAEDVTIFTVVKTSGSIARTGSAQIEDSLLQVPMQVPMQVPSRCRPNQRSAERGTAGAAPGPLCRCHHAPAGNACYGYGRQLGGCCRGGYSSDVARIGESLRQGPVHTCYRVAALSVGKHHGLQRAHAGIRVRPHAYSVAQAAARVLRCATAGGNVRRYSSASCS
eukprot:COSAG02_NODE_20515_length_827_cov_6.061555_1_plen_171_part_00